VERRGEGRGWSSPFIGDHGSAREAVTLEDNGVNAIDGRRVLRGGLKAGIKGG
jgi:hypothetical protein